MQSIPPHTGETNASDPGEHSPEGRWLTYGELSQIRGIGRESAVKLAQRKRWRRIPGNDGIARVFVPPDWLTPASPLPGKPPPEPSPEPPPERTLLAGALAALEDAVSGLRDQLAEAKARADRAEADTLSERQRADGLRDRLVGAQAELPLVQAAADRAHGEAQEALQRAEALEQAERARKARGRWARLRAAWRGE